MQNLIVTSSRGKSLVDLGKDPKNRILIKSGGRIKPLTKAAVKILKKDPAPYVYFVAGLPDISRKVSHTFRIGQETHLYQEFIFTESINQAINRTKSIIRKAESNIKEQHSTPVFCTITPFSIKTWNHHRLANHHTSHLLHFNDYDRQQENLHQVIIAINRFIHFINRQNGVLTPRLASIISYKRGRVWRYRYGKLWDGTHVNQNVAKKWKELLSEAFEKNTVSHIHNQLPDIPSPDSDSDSDSDKSEKRSWMY